MYIFNVPFPACIQVYFVSRENLHCIESVQRKDNGPGSLHIPVRILLSFMNSSNVLMSSVKLKATISDVEQCFQFRINFQAWAVFVLLYALMCNSPLGFFRFSLLDSSIIFSILFKWVTLSALRIYSPLNFTFIHEFKKYPCCVAHLNILKFVKRWVIFSSLLLAFLCKTSVCISLFKNSVMFQIRLMEVPFYYVFMFSGAV